MSSQKVETLNYLEIENRLLEIQARGIKKVKLTLQSKEDIIEKLEQVLDSNLNSDSDSEQSQEDELNFGKFMRQIDKSNPKEIIGMLKYQKRHISQLEQKYSGKVVLSGSGIKIYADSQKNADDLLRQFWENILDKIRSHNIDKYGQELYLSEKASSKLKQIKIINYSGDKFCYFYSLNEIDDNTAMTRISQVQNERQRKFVTFLGKQPQGTLLRKVLRKVLEIKMHKILESKSDQNTEISKIGNGFIIHQKDLGFLGSQQKLYNDILQQQCLMFVCLLKNTSFDIQEKLKTLKKVKKYLNVAFPNILLHDKENPQQVISMLIETKDLRIILSHAEFRDTLGKFLKQLFKVNDNSAFKIGFFLPYQNQYYKQLNDKFQSQILKYFTTVQLTSAIHKLKGINFYVPKVAEDDKIHELYLMILDSAVRRKMRCNQLKEASIINRNYCQVLQSNNNNTTLQNETNLNNTTMIHDQSIFQQSFNNVSTINIVSLNCQYAVNFNIPQPSYQEMENEFKRGQRDGAIQKLLKNETGELYKAWKIVLNSNRKQELKQQKYVTCMIKIADFQNENLYFQKIKYGKKLQKGLLVQLVVDHENMQQTENAFKLKTKNKIIYVPTHEIMLL